jgi:hypothetical protein
VAGLDDPTLANPTASPAATTTYTVTVTDALGNQGTNSMTVTVHPNPTADAGPDAAICAGGSTTIGGSPTASGGTPPYTYSWSPATGLDDPTLANPTASPAATTTYTVTVTDENGCEGSDSMTLTVNPNPTADAGPDVTINEGDSTVIGGSPTGSGGTPPYTYSWSPTTGLDDPTLPNPTASPLATTTYTVTVTDANGCEDTDSMTVTVITVEVPTADAGPDASICEGGSVVIGGDPTAMGGTPPYTYSWSPTTGLDDPTLANPTASPAVTTTYTVTVTDSNGETDSDEMTVTVNPNPTADAGADAVICAGESTTIGGNPTGSGGTPPYMYSWSPTAGLDDPTLANPTATPTETTTYTVTVTDANGCQDADDVTVTVNPNPVADAGPNASILPGESVIIGGSPTASGGTPPYTYLWSPAMGLDDPTLPNPTASPAATTTYTVTVTDANGCQDTDAMTVTVGAEEVGFLDIKPGSCPNSFNPRSKGKLPAAILGTADFDVEQIDRDTILLEGVAPLRSNLEDVGTPVERVEECDCTELEGDGFTDLTLKFARQDVVDAADLDSYENGSEVLLTLTGNLLDGTPFALTDCVRIVGNKFDDQNTTILGEAEFGLDSADPNPFTRSTRIRFALKTEASVSLIVYDVRGRAVASLVDEVRSAGTHSVAWDASGLPSGVYFYKLQVGAMEQTRKVVLTK